MEIYKFVAEIKVVCKIYKNMNHSLIFTSLFK